MEGLGLVLRVVHRAESVVDGGHLVVAATIALLPVRSETTVHSGASLLHFQGGAILDQDVILTSAPVWFGRALWSQVALLVGGSADFLGLSRFSWLLDRSHTVFVIRGRKFAISFRNQSRVPAT